MMPKAEAGRTGRRRRRDPTPPPLVPGVARALSPLVRRIVAPNPGLMTGPGTNTYLVGIDEIAVDRPGSGRRRATSTPSPAAVATASAGSSAPTPTPTTRPGAAGLKERTGAEVLAFASTRRLEGRQPDQGRLPHRGHRVPAPGAAHAGPRLEPPLLPPRRGAAALLRRPHHGGLDRGHQAARRRHGGLPRVPRQGAQAASEGDRAWTRLRHRRPQRRHRLLHRAPPRA